MNKIGCVFFLMMVLYGCHPTTTTTFDFSPNKVIPSDRQYHYQQMEMVGFIHFSMNTFTDKEWGYGDENPGIFNPLQFNAEQWIIAAKEGGLKELILTAKHHDGFCLWPSQYTEHSIKYSPYKNGHGDIVKEFIDACRNHRLKVGLYLSPWDRNHKDYGKPGYLEYYRNQIKELLTQYGKINEIWFDGANGGDGYYGGAREKRIIDRKSYYEWEKTFDLVKELQPDILIFSDAGPDLRWVGNENGAAGETFWSAISDKHLTIGDSDAGYLNTGDPNGNKWITGQCDVSIRPGWFYHKNQDTLVKSPMELLDIYYSSVGRNAVFLLNLPPDKRGLIHEKDIASLKGFKQILDETFKVNLASGCKVKTSGSHSNNACFSPSNIVDDDPETFWAADDGAKTAELTLDLMKNLTFDRILIQEPIRYGQRISRFRILVLKNTHQWEQVATGTTIGYKRLLRIKPVATSKIKIMIEDANNAPAISNFGLFLSPHFAMNGGNVIVTLPAFSRDALNQNYQ